MKKVFVLASAVLLLATPAMALITGTKHDLSSTSGNTIVGTSDEICVYCHTPHGAGSVGTAPLWNRAAGAAITSAYGNPAGTMDATADIAGATASDAPLCLSCHDGASLTLALNNPPNSGGGNPAVNIPAGSATLIGTDLNDDHPIGFDYTTATATDTELQLKATVEAVAGMTGALSYGGGNDMWCSSCHDVHGTGNASFLRMDNAGSALCLTCHIK